MKKLLIILLLNLAFNAEAQLTNFSEIWKEHEFRGDQLYEDGLYEAAIEAYEKQLLDEPGSNPEVIVRIAECHKHLGEYKKAAYYFSSLGRSFQLDEKYFEDYAEVLLADGKVEEALEVLIKLQAKNPQDKVISEKIEGITHWQDFFVYEEYAEVENTSLSTSASEFGIRKFNNGLAFTSSRIRDGLVQHNYLRDVSKLTAIYKVKSPTDNSAELVDIKKLRQSNDGPHAAYGYTYVISRSFKAPLEGKVVLGLYFYELNDNGELEPKASFPYNSPEYSITHPAYSTNGDTLYFASDMPGGFGGYDIYYSIFRDDLWSNPRNLGEPVNSARNELFPYSDKGTLYFASNGHAGLGGLDLYRFVSQKEGPAIENLGAPVNSTWDDFAIYITGNEGYLSSNRPGGQGLDDIYAFKLLPRPEVIEPVEVSLSIFDQLNETPVDGAEVRVISADGTIEAISDEHGNISKALMPGEYTVVVTRQLYNENSFKLTVEKDQPVTDMVALEPAIQVHLVSPDSILFKFGEYNLLHEDADDELDAIVETLKQHPEYSLKISAHTDSRGSKEYNQWLSEQRAETAAKYIIRHGIDPARIQQLGFGESQLLNNCRDGIRCSDELHAVNRRLEFDFIREEKPE